MLETVEQTKIQGPCDRSMVLSDRSTDCSYSISLTLTLDKLLLNNVISLTLDKLLLNNSISLTKFFVGSYRFSAPRVTQLEK